MTQKDRIFEKEGLTNPSPAAGLQNQVNWCTSTQNIQHMNPGALKMQRQNRLAAYEAGWMSMGDILFLEQTSYVLSFSNDDRASQPRNRHHKRTTRRS
jgi:hypothetical protein